MPRKKIGHMLVLSTILKCLSWHQMFDVTYLHKKERVVVNIVRHGCERERILQCSEAVSAEVVERWQFQLSGGDARCRSQYLLE